MPASPVVTDPTTFTYDLNTLRVTAVGTGFTYDAAGDVLTGTVTGYTQFVVEDWTGDPTPEVVPTLITHGQSLDISLWASATLATSDNFIQTTVLQFSFTWPQAERGFFWTTEDGQKTAHQSPLQVFFSAQSRFDGVAEDDILIFKEATAQINTLGGNDFVRLDHSDGDVRVKLNAGDDLFKVQGGLTTGGPEATGLGTTWVNAGAGNDRVLGGNGADEFRGFNGHDILAGLNGQDRLLGGGGDDQIFGGHHRDVMFGGAGRDILDGGMGDDVHTGGLGRDVFIFDVTVNSDPNDPAQTSEADRINDFAAGLDTLHFRDAGTDLTQAQAFALWDAHAVQDGANTVFTYQGGTITLLNTTKTDLTVDSFYDKPWLLPAEDGFL